MKNVLLRYEKNNETEFLWRFARACVEKARSTMVDGRKLSPEEKVYFIKKVTFCFWRYTLNLFLGL